MTFTFTPIADPYAHGYETVVGRWRVEYMRHSVGNWSVFVMDTVTEDAMSITQADSMLGDVFSLYRHSLGFLTYSQAQHIAHKVARHLFNYQRRDKTLWEDAWHIAWVGGSNITGITHTYNKWSNLYGANHPAVLAIKGHLDFLHGRGLGPEFDVLDQVLLKAREYGWERPHHKMGTDYETVS